MGFDTWKAEFYPEPAAACAKADALAHTRRKWTGALPRNRKKHGLKLLWFAGKCCGLVDPATGERFGFGWTTCALCNVYLCGECPVYPCWKHENLAFVKTGSVRPMLGMLRKAQRQGASRGASQ